MIKKKLPIQTKTAPTSKQHIQQPPPIEPDDEEVDVELDEEDEEAEEVEEEPPKSAKRSTAATPPAKVGRSSLAEAFDNTSATNNADDLPPGKYEAIVKNAVLQEPDAKGQSIRMSFDLCNPDLAENNQVTTWFKLFDANGNKVDGGIRAFKGTMAKLGYKPKFDELDEVLAEIMEERPGVLLKVSYSKDRDGNVWQRAVVDSLCDNEVVQEYKENVVF